MWAGDEGAPRLSINQSALSEFSLEVERTPDELDALLHELPILGHGPSEGSLATRNPEPSSDTRSIA